MHFNKYTTLTAALFICSLARSAAMELKESKAKIAVAAIVAAKQKEGAPAVAKAMADRQQGQWKRDYESLLPQVLPAAIHDIIKDYYFDEGDVKDAFLAILYRPVGQISDNKKIYQATLAANGKIAITQENAKTIKLWDISDKEIKEIKTLSIDNPRCCINTSPDGNIIIANLSKNSIQILDTTGTCLDTIKTDDEFLRRIATTHDAKTIVTTNRDHTIKIWNRATKACTATIEHAHNDYIYGLILTHDNIIITASWDTMVCLWNTEGQALAVQHSDGNKLNDHIDAIKTLTINHDNTIIATGAEDETAKLWDLKTGKCILTLRHNDGVYKVHIRPDGKIITQAKFGLVKIWDQKTGTCIANLSCRSADPSRWGSVLAISPDCNTFVTGSFNQTIWGYPCVHKFDRNAQQALYNLSFERLIKLKTLLNELEPKYKYDMPYSYDVPTLSEQQGAFLFSLPGELQRNILEHFDITETKEEFEKRTSEDRKSNT